MEKSKSKWPTLSISLGNIDTATERRGAYEAAAFQNQMSVSEWVKTICDKASNYKGA